MEEQQRQEGKSREAVGEGEETEQPLRQSLKDCFVLLEPEWENEGLWLIFRDEATAELYGCGQAQRENGTEEVAAGVSGWSPGSVFRCSLETAMRVTVSRDPKRRGHRRERNEMWEEWLGEEDEDLSK